VDICKIVEAFAERTGVAAGICDAAPILSCESAKLHSAEFVPFVSQDLERRTNPSISLSTAQSIITVGVGWSIPETVPCNDNKKLLMAELSSLGFCNDYHLKVKAILHDLIEDIRIYYPNFKHKILVDSPALDERTIAHRAKIGFIGKHGLLISPKFGSRFNIGLLLTDINVSDDASLQYNQRFDCCAPTCNQCIKACPTGALSNNLDGITATYDVKKCIAYLTQKETLTLSEKLLIQNQLYGCDICQNACPFNTPIPPTYINPEAWVSADDCTLTEKYAHTAMLWRGTDILRRNAKIVLENITAGGAKWHTNSQI